MNNFKNMIEKLKKGKKYYVVSIFDKNNCEFFKTKKYYYYINKYKLLEYKEMDRDLSLFYEKNTGSLFSLYKPIYFNTKKEAIKYIKNQINLIIKEIKNINLSF